MLFPARLHRRCAREALQGRRAYLRRCSPYSLYNPKIVSFDEAGGYDQTDATGFIKLNALRLRVRAAMQKK
jgi:argininosuccinate synthase